MPCLPSCLHTPLSLSHFSAALISFLHTSSLSSFLCLHLHLFLPSLLISLFLLHLSFSFLFPCTFSSPSLLLLTHLSSHCCHACLLSSPWHNTSLFYIQPPTSTMPATLPLPAFSPMPPIHPRHGLGFVASSCRLVAFFCC